MEQPQLDCTRKELAETERKLRRIYLQIDHLNYRLLEVQDRYDQAKETNDQLFQSTFRLQMVVIEGTLNNYKDNAVIQAEKLKRLQLQIYREALVDYDDSSSDEYEPLDDVTDGNIDDQPSH
jgi:hypothetical protein